jgi:hypothetical protein
VVTLVFIIFFFWILSCFDSLDNQYVPVTLNEALNLIPLSGIIQSICDIITHFKKRTNYRKWQFQLPGKINQLTCFSKLLINSKSCLHSWNQTVHPHNERCRNNEWIIITAIQKKFEEVSPFFSTTLFYHFHVFSSRTQKNRYILFSFWFRMKRKIFQYFTVSQVLFADFITF